MAAWQRWHCEEQAVRQAFRLVGRLPSRRPANIDDPAITSPVAMHVMPGIVREWGTRMEDSRSWCLAVPQTRIRGTSCASDRDRAAAAGELRPLRRLVWWSTPRPDFTK